MAIKFIDLFCGIWWFRIALDNLWWECVFSSDIDQDCRKMYHANFWELPHWDITKILPQDVPFHDVLCAWFPCQPFSISWKQKWFEDIRWNLFFSILEIIKEKQPKVVFLENVRHLKDHDNGNTLKTIISALEGVWYQAEWKILNAKDFWLAQNRERIIIVASKIKKFDFSFMKEKVNLIKIKDILDKNWDFEYLKDEEYTILDKKLWKEQKSWLIFCWYRNKSIRTIWVRPNTEHLSRVHKQPNRIYHIDGTHPTIPSQESSWRFWIYDWKKVRKLTINECFKLQGFPETYKKISPMAKLYNQIWNSVAIPMIQAMWESLINYYFGPLGVNKLISLNVPKLKFQKIDVLDLVEA